MDESAPVRWLMENDLNAIVEDHLEVQRPIGECGRRA